MPNDASAYVQNRARISVALSKFTVPLLSHIYQDFHGDMVAAIVLGEIAHRNVEAWLNDETKSEDELYDPQLSQSRMRPCNALSIADACGIPRETVRRKVVTLIERKYIYRDAKGHLYLTNTVGDDFQDRTQQIVEHLLATARRLEALLAMQRPPLGPLQMDRSRHP